MQQQQQQRRPSFTSQPADVFLPLVKDEASPAAALLTERGGDQSPYDRPPASRCGCLARHRERLAELFEESATQALVVGVILLSTVCVMLETVPDHSKETLATFSFLEKFVTCFFTMEICIRIFIADEPCQYMTQLGNVVDVLAVLPWYIEYLMRRLAVQGARAAYTEDLADAFQLVRLMRVLRLAKAARHSTVVAIVLESVYGSLEGLSALFAFVCMGTVFAATLVFFLECEDEGTAFVSIPAAVWWALPTVTGVGYGDMVPQTLGGKMAAAVTMVGGVLITSLTVAITTNSFIEQFQKNMNRAKVTQTLRRSRSKPTLQSGRGSVLSSSAQDLAGLVYNVDLAKNHLALAPRLPKIEKELHDFLIEIQATLRGRDIGFAPTPGSLDSTREALLTSLDNLQEQSKVWFKQVQRVADDIIRLECQAEGGSFAEAATPSESQIVMQSPCCSDGEDVQGMPGPQAAQTPQRVPSKTAAQVCN